MPRGAFSSYDAVPFRSLELEKGLLEKRIEGLLAETRDHGLLSAAAEDSVTPRAADAIRLLRQRVEQMGQHLQASTVPSAYFTQRGCSTPIPRNLPLYTGTCALQAYACRACHTFQSLE